MKKKIYLAGGWFDEKQEEQHSRVYNLIKDKYDVFNPRLAGEVAKSDTADRMTKILLGNIEAIQDADIVVVLYDFRDTGTIWESGFAYGICKPVIYLAEYLDGKRFNLMLAKTGRFAKDTDTLLKMLEEEDSYNFYIYRNEYNGEIE